MRAGHVRKNASGGGGGGNQLYDINCTLHTGRMIHENWTSRKQARGAGGESASWEVKERLEG